MNFRDYGFTCTIANHPVPTKNHDAICVGECSIAVVDGATPLGTSTANLNLEVLRLSTAVSEMLTRSDIEDPFRRFLDVAETLESPDGNSAVAAAVWLSSNNLICGAIGDCIVAIHHFNDSFTLLLDPILETLDNKVVDAMYPSDGIFNLAYVNELLRKNRMKANAPDGYGAFGVPGLTSSHIKTSKVPLSEIKTVLICSDGFWRSIEPYGIFKNVNELLIFLGHGGDLNEIVTKIRSIEKQDPVAKSFRRISPADDISAVLLTR